MDHFRGPEKISLYHASAVIKNIVKGQLISENQAFSFYREKIYILTEHGYCHIYANTI